MKNSFFLRSEKNSALCTKWPYTHFSDSPTQVKKNLGLFWEFKRPHTHFWDSPPRAKKNLGQNGAIYTHFSPLCPIFFCPILCLLPSDLWCRWGEHSPTLKLNPFTNFFKKILTEITRGISSKDFLQKWVKEVSFVQ